jgi:peptidoglycan/LPS O-acetylase OafA/YrhL
MELTITLLLVLLSILFLSIFIINKIIVLPDDVVRYKSIDGLRGYLAFFVFLHHSYIWYFFLKNDVWEEPKSNLFNHFGQTSVLFFFMITSFLFTSKIINRRNKEIDWNALFKSRFYRLIPMYIFSILILFFIVTLESNFTINDKTSHIFRDVIKWLAFTISSNPNINNVKDTYLINAGVAWSLPYEWIFYFSLPLLALFFGGKPSRKIMFFTITILVYLLIENKPKKTLIFSFIGGIIAALIQNKFKDIKIFKSNLISIIIIILLFITVHFFNSGVDIIPIFLSSIIFILISLNNSIFGILHWPISRKLGQITYSIYLLHGIVLYCVFHYIIGIEILKNNTVFDYWSIIAICIFPLLLICQITYKYIELPFMKMAKQK